MSAAPELGRATGVERDPSPEAEATQELYRRHAGRIHAFCLHELGDRQEAEDAAQITFLNAFRALRRGVTPENESAWLFKIAHNVCLTRLRSSSRRGRIESPGDFQALQDVVPARAQSGADELMELQEVLAGMTVSQRRAILLREWQGLSYREIAKAMELSQSAVETLIFRARRSLASGLERVPSARPALRRVRQSMDVGAALSAAKALLAGSAAVKAAATVAVVATTVAAVATVPSARERAPAPSRAERAPVSPLQLPAESPRLPSSTRDTNGERRSASPTTPAPGGSAPSRPKTRLAPALDAEPASPSAGEVKRRVVGDKVKPRPARKKAPKRPKAPAAPSGEPGSPGHSERPEQPRADEKRGAAPSEQPKQEEAEREQPRPQQRGGEDPPPLGPDPADLLKLPPDPPHLVRGIAPPDGTVPSP